MSIDIKVGVFRRTTRPATWRDVVTEILWAILAVVCALRFVPVVVEHTAMSTTTGVFLSITFGLVALMHSFDAFKIVRGLRKPKVTA